MKLSLIVAMDENGVIGKEGGLPWHLSADLQYFKKITLGKPIIMGRKTYESIGRPLPGRRNIVITRNSLFDAPGCDVFTSLEAALAEVENIPEVMMIGGATLYKETLQKADKIYLTQVHAAIEGDTVFPDYDQNEWAEISRERFVADEKNEYDYSFIVLQKIPLEI